MKAIIVRTHEEIRRQMDKITDAIAGDETRYPGMTFEQGCEDMYKWLVGLTDTAPIDDEE